MKDSPQTYVAPAPLGHFPPLPNNGMGLQIALNDGKSGQ
jgi:hypothetical protein